jgi:GT2 family glycosyltransferase
MASGANLRIAVILASTGRPENLGTAIRHFHDQTMKPDCILLSVVTEQDVPLTSAHLKDLKWVIGPKGLPTQRNTGLRNIGKNYDVIAFFDDDYIPSRYCIERLSNFFSAHPDVIGANGFLVADGINTPGISTEKAELLLRLYDEIPAPDTSVIKDQFGLYGCNMAYRASALNGIWFDERLKLYGWQEDIDFAAQLLKRGRIVKTHAFAGVHQGVKGGRTSGVRLGYSQVSNPLYLARKGTMKFSYALKIMGQNILANHLRSLKPEPWVDRLGRAKGNWIGIFDVLRGRLTPERIETL